MRYPILLLCFFIAACNNFEKEGSFNKKEHRGLISSFRDTVGGMQYIIYNYLGSHLQVVNLTKDSLECEFYKKEIQASYPEYQLDTKLPIKIRLHE